MSACYFRQHYPAIISAMLILVFAMFGEKITSALCFERISILEGEFYRLLTAHWVHLGWLHTLMNLLAVIIGWLLFFSVMKPEVWLLSLIIQSIVISLLLLVLHPVDWYVGFSGLIHGLMLQCILLDKTLGLSLKSVVVGGLFFKVLYELYYGAISNNVSLGGEIVVEAHLYGLLAGLLMVLMIRRFSDDWRLS